ncbi:hypothetical protein AAFC00_000048 [Neodothiora populina]|uniref:PalH-domain-containing protein n=1 Tax=Neodothiora populina TaxID=2781224 RepID=A0ABR3P219_9PEZI
MSPAVLEPRQLWDLPTTAANAATPSCTPFTLPSGGVISYAHDHIVTLTANLVFQPQCTSGYHYPGQTDPSSVADLQEPFYSSTIPQTYVVATTTVLAWVLVVMLVINPRSFYMGGIGTNFASGRGLIGGATGAGSGPGVGSRPWLQKVATLAVAVSMTIATADTFKVAEAQYWRGYMDANAMRARVEGSMEIRVVRVISDIFLWLAQVQTLIRLFPRHKEKVLIKWIGFALIILDTTFSCLNSFMVDNITRPRNFVDAIPALSYLFELAVGLLYAAWVIFYGITKRRYAYYHRRMRNICVVALLSHVAILTPVVFFVTDVSEPDVAAWGDYFRWVGSAAASVVVWEWVERIEALERDEKKDGILGREIFDGDEMLDFTPAEEMTYTRKPRDDYRPLSRAGDDKAKVPKQHIRGLSLRRRFDQERPRRTHFPLGRTHTNPIEQRSITFGDLPRPPAAAAVSTTASPSAVTQPTPPPPRVISPPSRADTTSAASTVYVVNYDGQPDVPQPVRRINPEPRDQAPPDERRTSEGTEMRKSCQGGQSRWQHVPHPFKRKRMTPPAEIRAATETTASTTAHTFPRWHVTARLGAFAAEQGERFRERRAERRETAENDESSWTVIPAQPRGAAAWSPSVLEKEQAKSKDASQPSTRLSSEGTTAARDFGATESEPRDSEGSRQLTWSDTTAASSARPQTEGAAVRPATGAAESNTASDESSGESNSSNNHNRPGSPAHTSRAGPPSMET